MLALLGRQEARYLAVGGLNAVFSICAYAGSRALLRGQVSYVALLIPTYALGILFSFVTQRYLVFRVRGQVWTDLLRFTLVQLVGLGLNALALPAVHETTHLPVVVSQVVALMIVVVITYFSHIHFSFRRGDTAP